MPSDIEVHQVNISQALLTWSVPGQSHNEIKYVIKIQPLPQSGICRTGQCTFHTEFAIISGLEININYTLSISASVCQMLSDGASTYILLRQKGNCIAV